MSGDAGSRQPDAPTASFELPPVRSIRIRRIDYEAPRRRNFESAFADVHEAMEFLVTTGGPIPRRALGAALYVGDTARVQADYINPMRFSGADEGGAPDFVCGGRYAFGLVRTSIGWRMHRVTVHEKWRRAPQRSVTGA